MKIVYFIRSKEAGISIKKHFEPLIAEIGKTEEVETYFMPYLRFNVKNIVKNIIFTYKHRCKDGINHVTGDCHYIVWGLLGCKKVLTVHDMVFFYTEKSWLKKKLLFLIQIYLPFKIVDKVIAISDKTKKEIETILPFKREIVVAKHISIDQFKYAPKDFSTEHVRVLQNGTEPRKNLETTMRAVAKLGYELRVIRRMTEEQKKLAAELGLKYSNVYDLSDEELVQEYVDADIVCMPSLYEGFGAMVLEAQATGRPVITTAIDPMPAVSGGAAYMMQDPLDAEEMANAMKRIVEDSEYRESLIKTALENASQYTVANCAKEHVEVYKSLG